MNLYPFRKPSSSYPTFLYGWHNLAALRSAQSRNRINHLFAPGLHNFPILKTLTNPVVYSLSTSPRVRPSSRTIEYLQQIAAVVVNDRNSQNLLTRWGFKNVHVVPVGIDILPFEKDKLELSGKLHLLMASAPWEISQFHSKGIDLLLAAAKEIPSLYLTFLWRGHLRRQMEDRLEASGLRDQVRLIDRKVDINLTFKEVHGAVLLTRDSSLVKAYPHSLLESLLSGKPVLLSDTISMHHLVDETKTGIIVRDFNLGGLKKALWKFQENYVNLASRSFALPPQQFDRAQLIVHYHAVYDEILG